jgi:hypothetical protein
LHFLVNELLLCKQTFKIEYLKKYLLIAFLIVFTTHSQAQTAIKTGLTANAGSSILKFYPNPATTVVNFDFQKGFEKGFNIQIFSFLGRKMYESSNLNEKTTINLSDFTRGVYIYQLRDRSGRLIESGKFQVSK